MKMKELEKDGGLWRIYQTERRLSYQGPDGGMSWSEETLDKADAAFETHIRKKLKDGWSETEHSQTRRVFKFVDDKSRKAWIAWLSGNDFGVQFGKIPKDLYLWSDKSGSIKVKPYPTREKAVAAYEKAIAKKMEEGYEEVLFDKKKGK